MPNQEGRTFKVEAVIRKEYPNNPAPHSYRIDFRVFREKRGGWSGSHGWQHGLKADQVQASTEALKRHLNSTMKKGDTMDFKVRRV